MQILIRGVFAPTRAVHVAPDDVIGDIRRRLCSGVEAKLIYGGRVMRDALRLVDYDVKPGAELTLSGALRGGGAVRVRIQPRLQKETWSLYWRESMHTETTCLAAFDVETEPTATIADLQAKVAAHMKWTPVGELLRLEGFEESWQRCLMKGRELEETKTLEQCGVAAGSVLTIVRKELIAEGWAIHVDDDDVSTSDESEI